MSEASQNNPQNKPSNEIDLINLFERIFASLRKGVIQLYELGEKLFFLLVKLAIFCLRIFSWNIRFVLKKLPWFILAFVIAIGAVYALFISGALINYAQGTVIKTRMLSAAQLRPYFESFNQYLDAEDYGKLSAMTGVPVEELKKIKSIDSHFFLDMDGDGQYDMVDFKDDYKTLISVDRDRVEREYKDARAKAKEGIVVEKPEYKVSVNEAGLYLELIPINRKDSIMNFDLSTMMIRFVDSLPEYQQALEMKFKFSAEKRDRIQEEINWVDTLRISELRRRENGNGNTNPNKYDGKAAVIIDQKSADKPEDNSLLTSGASLALFDKKQDLEKSLFYRSDPIIHSLAMTKKDIDAIGAYQHKTFPFLKMSIEASILAFIACYLILLLRRFRKPIVKELGRSIDEL